MKNKFEYIEEQRLIILKALTDFGWKYKEDIPKIEGLKINCLEEIEVKKGQEKNAKYYIDRYNEIVMWKRLTTER